MQLHPRISHASAGNAVIPFPSGAKLGGCRFEEAAAADMERILALASWRRLIEPGNEFLYEGDAHHSVFVVLQGWVCSSKLTRRGTRQVTGFQLPGDFINLNLASDHRCELSAQALTRVELLEMDRITLQAEFAACSGFSTMMQKVAAKNEAAFVERLVDMGRRTALERTAHFFLETGVRLAMLEMGTREQFGCPLTQGVIADAIGLTAVHLNRILRELREAKLMTFKEGCVTIGNYARLVHIADFDEAYLQ